MTKSERRIVTPGPDPRDRQEFKEEAAVRCLPRGANRAARRREEVQPRNHRRNAGWGVANQEADGILKRKRAALKAAHAAHKHAETKAAE